MRFDREAFNQKSSVAGRVKELLRGYCDVELPDGRVVRKVHFAMGVSWPVGSQVQIERVGKDWQVIGYAGRLTRSVTEEAVTPPFVIIDLALWSQYEGSPQLMRSAFSTAINPTNTGGAVVMTGSGLIFAPFFDAVIDRPGRLIAAYPLRDGGDTFWEKIRLKIRNVDTSEDVFEANISTSPSTSWLANTWTNAAGNLIFVIDHGSRQIWRRKGPLFEQITLTDLAGRETFGANISPLGVIVTPQYALNAEQTTTATAPLSSEAVTYGNGIAAPTDSEKIQAWAADIFPTTVPRTWAVDLSQHLTAANPVVNNVTSFGKPCILPNGTTVLLWVSGHARLPYAGLYNRNLHFGFDNENLPTDTPTQTNTSLSELVQGVVCAVNATNGTLAWKYVFEKSPPVPGNPGLVAYVDNWLSANWASLADDTLNTYSGVLAQNGMTGRVVLGDDVAADNDGFSFNPGAAFNPGGGTYSLPNYQKWTNAAFISLPLEEANTLRPVDVLGNPHNLNVFTDWVKTAVNGLGRFDQRLGIVGDHLGNAYVPYLEPDSILVQGRAGHVVNAVAGTVSAKGKTDGQWGAGLGLRQDTFPTAFTSFLWPDVQHVYGKKIAKFSPTGTLLHTYDLTQLATADWFATEVEMGGSTVDSVIGGASSEPIKLADNLYKISPCGRVVFVLDDRHDLGPNYMPATYLLILDAAANVILHEIPLRSSEDLISSDVYGLLDETENFTADGATQDYTLTYTPYSVTSVTRNSTPVSYTVSGAVVTLDDLPDMGDLIEVEYRYQTSSAGIEFRNGERRWRVDPTALEIRSVFQDDEGEVCYIEVQQFEQVVPEPVTSTAETVYVQIGTNITDFPTVLRTNVTGSARSAISNGQWFSTVFDTTWKIIVK